MERRFEFNQLSQMVHIESLLGKLGKSGAENSKQSHALRVQVEQESKNIKLSREKVIPLELKISESSSIDPIYSPHPSTLPVIEKSNPPELGTFTNQNKSNEIGVLLTKIHDLLVKDILASRDRLLQLNPSRQQQIEHRLEFIARKVARARGEKLNRSFYLPDILRETYREGAMAFSPSGKLSIAAWNGYVSEVSLYKVLEIFFLKALQINGWRTFDSTDLARMNFAAHSFLTQRANDFSHDRHCWNFVRLNLYSWYSPSSDTISLISRLLEDPQLKSFKWSDQDLLAWVKNNEHPFTHLDFESDEKIAEIALDVIEKHLNENLTGHFHAQPVCKKFFIPALELGGIARGILDRMVRSIAPKNILCESTQLHRSIWGCESESFEIYWTEVLCLLRALRSTEDVFSNPGAQAPFCPYRLPHVLHSVHLNGPELHNLEQLSLGSSDVSKLHQGSAAQIQQYESFDYSIVIDHIDRQKSGKWMKAVSDQIPYWSRLISGSSLNWGEIHLFLGLSKVREGGLCLYFSHRTIPDSGDGEKLRKALFGLGTLEYYIDFNQFAAGPYRYLYVFRKNTERAGKSTHHAKIGILKKPIQETDFSNLEESSSSQADLLEKGWEHLFFKGTAPLLRYLNQKFSKLGQFATVQTVSSARGWDEELFATSNSFAIEAEPITGAEGIEQGRYVKFDVFNVRENLQRRHRGEETRSEHHLIFPHNASDLYWIKCLLETKPAQFWIRNHLYQNKHFKFAELKNCPMLNLSHPDTDLIEQNIEWLSEQSAARTNAENQSSLLSWALHTSDNNSDKVAKFIALTRKQQVYERNILKYRPLFSNIEQVLLKPDAIGYFYPNSLLGSILDSPELRIKCLDRNKSHLLPENWTLVGSTILFSKNAGNKESETILQISTRQGPVIHLHTPSTISEYLHSQFEALRSYTWSEALSMVRVPKDLVLFSAQVAEIKRVVLESIEKQRYYRGILDCLATELFEIPGDYRQFLNP